MTDLNKKLKRRTLGTVFDRGHRRVIVTLHPGDRIGLRLERTKKEYIADVSAIYRAVVRWTVDGKQRALEARIKSLVKQGMTRREAKKIARQEGL